jgi:hypothetical protein
MPRGLRFAAERSYDLEFRWPHPVRPGTILLTIGSLNRRVAVPQAAVRRSNHKTFKFLAADHGTASL